MQKLLNNSQKDLFICGGSDNEKDFYSSFRVRFMLYVDNEALRKRLQAMHPERYKTNSLELIEQLKRNKGTSQYAQEIHAILINCQGRK